MKNVKITKVESRKDLDAFVHFSEQLYADCEQYVPDLESDIRETFDPDKNAGLEFSEIQGFLAYKDGKVAGRIAGIINRRANEKWQIRCVRFGMIDFIDDKEVSAALLHAVEAWGKERGMDCIEGPLGITDFDKEGMLIEDFHLTGSMTAIYNYPYYKEHMEAQGYDKAADWLQVHIEIPEKLPEKYTHAAELSKKLFHLKVRKLTYREMTKEGYGYKIFHLLNKAYEPLFGFSAMSDKQAKSFIENYLRVIDLNLLPIVEDKDGNLVAVAVTMGSMSQALRKSKGRLFPFGWYHLLKALKWKREEGAEMLLIAVDPKYQGLGVNALIFEDLLPIYRQYGFKWAETGPQLEDNVKELSQWQPLNPDIIKRRRCFKKSI